MTLFYIVAYHNTDSQFLPYEPEHALTMVLSHWRNLPAETSPEDIADWAYRVFNADLDDLESRRVQGGGGELDFLLACTYRLLGRRSLSTGDVIAIVRDDTTTFLACEVTGWRPVPRPENRTGQPLTAETIYNHLNRDRHA
jgi:hypothetical protein